MTANRIETETLPHGLTAVLVPHGLTAAQLRALHARLGLICRHGAMRATYGRCPACAEHRREVSA